MIKMVNWFIDMMQGMNILGLGPEPIALALAGTLAMIACSRGIRERYYKDLAVAFIMNWMLLFIAGLAHNAPALLIGVIIVFLGMVFNREDAAVVTHNINKN